MRFGWRLLQVFFAAMLLLGLLISPQRRYDTERDALSSIGDSIYIYHRQTGRWPTDGSWILTEPAHRVVQSGRIVVAWHVNLSSDPKQNGDAILAYEAKGLRPLLGFSYVCWGDLK